MSTFPASAPTTVVDDEEDAEDPEALEPIRTVISPSPFAEAEQGPEAPAPAAVPAAAVAAPAQATPAATAKPSVPVPASPSGRPAVPVKSTAAHPPAIPAPSFPVPPPASSAVRGGAAVPRPRRDTVLEASSLASGEEAIKQQGLARLAAELGPEESAELRLPPPDFEEYEPDSGALQAEAWSDTDGHGIDVPPAATGSAGDLDDDEDAAEEDRGERTTLRHTGAQPLQAERTRLHEKQRAPTILVRDGAAALEVFGPITAEQGGPPPVGATALWERQPIAILGADEIARPTLPAAESVDGLLDDLGRELALAKDPVRAARLNLEIGRVWEEEKRDAYQAETRYLAAFELSPSFRPNLRAAQALFRRSNDLESQLRLLDAEIAATPDQAERAELYWERGRLQLLGPGKPADVRGTAADSFRLVLSEAPGDMRALRALERVHLLAGAHEALLETLRHATTATDDPAEQAGMLFQMARLREREYNDVDSAADLVAVAAGLFPMDPVILAEQVRLQENRQSDVETAEALERLVEALGTPTEAGQQLDPAAGSVLWRLAELYRHRLGREDLAAVRLEQLAALGVKDRVALVTLRDLYARAGLRNDLARILERELGEALDPRDRVATGYALGEVRGSLGDVQGAVRALTTVLDIDPTHHPSLRALGRIYSNGGHIDRLAVMHQREAEAQATPIAKSIALWRAGRTLERTEPDRAIEIYERSLRARVGFAPSLRALERLYASRARWEELVALYESEISSSKEVDRQVALLAEVIDVWERELRAPERAIDAAQRLLVLEPSNDHALHTLDRLYARTEQWEMLAAVREMEAERTSERTRSVTLLAEAARIREERLLDAGRAIETYRKVLRLDPVYLPALSSLGRLLRRQARWGELVDMHRAEIGRGVSAEQAAALLYEIGEVYERETKDPVAAEAAYRDVLTRVRNHGQAIRALVRIAEARGDDAGIAATLSTAAQATDDASEKARLWTQAGLILEDRLGRLEEAETAYRNGQRAVAGHASSALALLDLLARRGEWHKLAEACRRALQDETDPARRLGYLERLAEVFDQYTPNPERAAIVYEQILEIAPAHPLALRALCRIYERLERWVPLVDVLRRRADVSRDDTVRFAVTMDLAKFLEHRLSDEPGAADAYRRAAQIMPSHPLPARALASMGVAEDPEGTTETWLNEARARASYGALTADESDRLQVTDSNLRETRALRLLKHGERAEDGGDLVEADRAFMEALEAVPDSLPVVVALKRVRFKLRDWARYAWACETEGRLLADKERAAIDFLAAGTIWREKLNRRREAVACFEKAFALVPTSRATFARLRGALEEAGSWERLLEHYASRVALETDPEELVALFNEVAVIHGDRLGDDQKAAESLMRGLERRPDDFRTLAALAVREERLARYDRAISTLGRAAAAATGIGERTAVLRARARIASERVADPNVVGGAWKDLLDASPEDAAGLENYAALMERTGDVRLAATAREKLDAVLTEAPVVARRENALRLMRLFATRLGDQAGTARAARRVLQIDPTCEEGIEVLAETLLRTGQAPQLQEHLGLSARAVRQVVAIEPLEPAFYRTLARIAYRRRYRDELFQATSALAALDEPPDELSRFADENRVRALSPPRRPLGADDTAERLVENAARGAAHRLLASGMEGLAKVAGDRMERLGLTKQMKVVRATFPARVELDACRAAAALGDEIEIYLDPGEQGDLAPVRAVALDVASIVVRARAMDKLASPAGRFLLGRALIAAAWGHEIARRLGADALERHLHALAGTSRPGILPQGEEVTELSKRIGKVLPRKARKPVEDLTGPYLVERRGFRAAGFLEGLERTEDRYGLLCAGDPVAAVAAMLDPWSALLGGAGASPAAVRATVSQLADVDPLRQRVAALLAFAVSEEHLVLRERVGVSLDR